MNARRIAALILPVLFSAGCVHIDDCNGIKAALTGDVNCRALTGDKYASLELGRRYEAGIGYPKDLRIAARHYRIAASDTSGITYIYSPPVRKGGSGRVIPVRVGPNQPGLAEAKYRLALLYLKGEGVKLDRERAMGLMREAANEGFAAAASQLQALSSHSPPP